MARWSSLEPADAGLFLPTSGAPHVFRYEMRYAASPKRVWESLASDASLAAWSTAIAKVTWLSPRPFGVGTTREVVIAPGLTRVRERFFRWDEGRGYSFYVYEASAPLFRRFAEDYDLTPEGDGTRFTWTIAIEPKRALSIPLKAIAPVLRAAFGRVAADGRRYFANGG